ncbi:MAG: hypothetical protein U0528_00760 [Anaerolineae bacterium]
MSRWRGYYDRFNTADPVIRLIMVAGLVLVMAIALPRFMTITGSGIDCANLPVPSISGSNQSWLAQQPGVADNLKLELVTDRQVFSQGEPLVLYVRFINDGLAPLTLYLTSQSVIFRYNNEEIGVLLFLQELQSQRIIGENANVNRPLTAPQQYTSDQLRSLGPRHRCSVRIEISWARLQTAGATTGQYRAVVTYRNNTTGILPPVAGLTPTPVFTTQGVWTGTVQSNDVLFNIG